MDGCRKESSSVLHFLSPVFDSASFSFASFQKAIKQAYGDVADGL